MTRARTLFRVVLAALVLTWAVPSDAARYLHVGATGTTVVTCTDATGFAHWDHADVGYLHNLARQGNGKATALRNAMQSWTNVPAANHVLTYAGITTLGFAQDGQNVISWGVGNGCTNPAICLAITSLWVRDADQVIVEADIMFNDNTNWFTNGNDNDTEAVAAHELGHSLGLAHTDVTGAPEGTMLAGYIGGTSQRSLEHDDCAGLECSAARYCIGPAGSPPRPATLDVVPALCNGLNDVEWDPSPGATYYELYKSSTSSFTTQTLEYSGPNTFDSVNVPGTRYLRVRACNASGCSCYKVGNRPATHTNGCF